MLLAPGSVVFGQAGGRRLWRRERQVQCHPGAVGRAGDGQVAHRGGRVGWWV